MRPRGQTYQTLDKLADAVPWYWRLLAFASWLFIGGGFLMLPATFETQQDPGNLRIPGAAVGIFAAALLAAGFSFTALLCFAVQSARFQIDYIFIPALISSGIGLLTVFYDFLVFTRYTFNTPALLTIVVAAIATIIYALLLTWFQRKIVAGRKKQQAAPLQMTAPAMTHQRQDSTASLWQDPVYYENYTRNMFPTAHVVNQPPVTSYGYDPNQITEEEMQRQQMLMLLLQKDQPTDADSTLSTFRIEWQGRDDEDALSPLYGHYAPQSSSAFAGPSPGMVRQFTNELRPWDGVWRTPARVSHSMWARPTSRDLREARRIEIEQNSSQ